MYLHEPIYGAVVGALDFGWKDTAGQFSRFPVIGDTFTALAFPGARLIGTGAFHLVRFNIAFHVRLRKKFKV